MGSIIMQPQMIKLLVKNNYIFTDLIFYENNSIKLCYIRRLPVNCGYNLSNMHLLTVNDAPISNLKILQHVCEQLRIPIIKFKFNKGYTIILDWNKALHDL